MLYFIIARLPTNQYVEYLTDYSEVLPIQLTKIYCKIFNG